MGYRRSLGVKSSYYWTSLQSPLNKGVMGVFGFERSRFPDQISAAELTACPLCALRGNDLQNMVVGYIV